jgi:hypothetical protein
MDYGVYSRHSACLRTISARCQIQSTPRKCTFALQSYEKSSAKQKNPIYFLCRDGVTYLKIRKNYEL